MEFDEIDLKMLRENFADDEIFRLDSNNVASIIKYLEDNNVYYIKDLLINSLDLFFLSPDEFITRFEKLKARLGEDFVDKLGEDASLIEIMYED